MKLSIRWTILIGCIALVWGTHLIITPSSYFMSKRVMTSHMHDVMVNISELARQQIYNHLKIAGPSYGRDGELKGLVGVDIELDELSAFISNLRVGKSGQAFIIHRNGDVITYDESGKLTVSPQDDKIMHLPKVDEVNNLIVQNAFAAVAWQKDNAGNLLLDKPEMTTFKQNGKTYLSMFTPFPTPELPWIIGVYIPEEDYLAEIKSNQLVNIIITLIITIMASILGLFLAGRIAGPIVKLSQGARAIEKNNTTPPLRINSPFREIQETADSFARMKDSVADYKRKLQDNEKIYRAITRYANDAIIMTDNNHSVTYFNPAAKKMFGYTNDEVIGKKLVDFLAPQQDERSYQEGIAMFMEDETGALMEQTVSAVAMCKNGREIPIELSLSRLKLNDAWHAVAIIRNITERQRAELLRKRLVNDLHDGIGGNLTNIKLLAEMSRTHDIPEHTSINLRYIAEISMECITEIRNYMNILDDTELSWQSFIAELHQYCAKTLEPHNIEFSMPLDISDEVPPPTTLLYMNIFKIVKEAINNVIKHSGCDSVKLDTLIRKSSAQWIIKDNGVGNISSLNGGRGLLSMTSRIKELGGTIRFAWDDGAQIVLNIPFTRTTVREQMLRDRNTTKPRA